MPQLQLAALRLWLGRQSCPFTASWLLCMGVTAQVVGPSRGLQTCSLCNPCCAGVELQWTSSNAVLLAGLPGDVTLLGTGSTAAILPASQGPASAEAVTAMLQAATSAAQANADKRAKLMVEAQKVNHHAARCGVCPRFIMAGLRAESLRVTV